MKEQSYTFTPPMGRTACTEPQCLYKGDLYLYLYFIYYSLRKNPEESIYYLLHGGKAEIRHRTNMYVDGRQRGALAAERSMCKMKKRRKIARTFDYIS